MVSSGRKARADSPFVGAAADLAAFVRRHRQEKGMSQQAVASAAGVSVSWLSKLEQGVIVEPGLFPVLAVLRVIGVKFPRLC